jgi:hypothetical protein
LDLLGWGMSELRSFSSSLGRNIGAWWKVSGDFNVEIDGEILARVERDGNHVQNRR